MIDVEIIMGGKYQVRPHHQAGNGRLYISILRIDDIDEHDHPVGPDVLIDVEALFAEHPAPIKETP